MKTDNFKELFDQLDFDIAEPADHHEDRFLQKLKQRSKKKTARTGVISLWFPGMAIAATFLIAVLVFKGLTGDPFVQEQELATVSPEMKQTQDFYASVIKTELENLKEKKTPETESVINDALKQLEILESDYKKLKEDLGKSGQDKRVIYAMISNFQKRIDLLNIVLEKVNTINSIKSTTHENTTI